LKDTLPEAQFSTAAEQMGLKATPNFICPEIQCLPSRHQFQGSMCGFYMYYNAKVVTRALLAANKYEQLSCIA